MLRSPVGRVAVVVAAEALALLVVAVGYAVGGLSGDARSAAGSEVGALLLAVAAALLVLVARGLLRRHPRAYAPAFAVQLLAALTAFSLLQTLPVVAVVVLAVAGLALQQLLTETARRELVPGPDA